MIELLFIVAVLLLLVGIFVRSGRGRRRQRGIFARPCPYCREMMHGRATICASCGRERPKRASMHDRLWSKP